MERVLPKTIDYTDVLPLAVESKSRRRTFFPTNGQTFRDSTNNIVRIDISADALLDTQHSYLRFTTTLNTRSGGIDFAGGHSFIRRLRIEQSGTILEDIQNYNKLMGGIVLPCQCGDDYVKERSITEHTKAPGSCEEGVILNGFDAAAVNVTAVGADADDALGVRSMLSAMGGNNNISTQIAAGNSVDFCIPLTSGIFNNEKLIPLMLMSAPLTIEIELAPRVQATVSAVDATGTYDWSNVRYIANLVEVGQDVAQQLRMVQEMSGGVLTLAGQTYRHFSGTTSAGAESVINIPARVKSMKSIFFYSAKAGADAFDKYNLGNGVCMDLKEYQLKIGSVVYPPTPVQCQVRAGDHANSAGQRAEQLMELAKAWGNVGSNKGLGMLNTLNYGNKLGAAADTGADGGAVDGLLDAGGAYEFCPFGLDLEAFQRVAIESGVNTADRSLPISLILAHAGNQEALTLDAFILADALFYINADGSMSVSV